MTAQEIQKRNQRSEHLRVIQVDDENFYVESSEGKICYKVLINDAISCTCGDFARGIKSDPKFRCKHILSVTRSNVKDIKNGEVLEKRTPKLDLRFIKTIDGKDFALYSGLLDLAHQKGLLKIEVEVLQNPSKENEHLAICKAIAVSSTGESFTDVGDANPINCSSRVSKHLLRMASTRAKARCLRDMTNIGMTCLEELDTADLGENSSLQTRPETRKAPASKTNSKKNDPKPSLEKKEASSQASKGSEKPTPKKEEKKEPAPQSNQDDLKGVPKMSEAQYRAIGNLSRRRGISMDELEKTCQETYGTSLEELSSKDASAFIRTLQTAA